MKKNILFLESIADEAFQVLEANEKMQLFLSYKDSSDSIEKIISDNEIHAIIVRGKIPVDERLIKSCKGLKVIARCGVGLDNVDIKAATKQGVKVINAPGINASTIAEHTLGLMLMLVRNLYRSAEKVKEGNWLWRNQYKGDDIEGKTLGILGFGNIGKKVAAIAQAFGMKIIYWDKFAEDKNYTKMDFEEVLSQSDIITIHLPLLPDTEKLIGKKELELMKSDVYLINTARGPIIDQKALTECLEKGEIAGFAADVLEDEPPLSDEKITKLPNTVITPHSGSLTTTTFLNMSMLTAKNVAALLEGKVIDSRYIYNK